MYEDLCLYIDGKFIKGDGRFEQDVFNPATNEVIGKLPHATREDLDLALTSAQRAFQSPARSLIRSPAAHQNQDGDRAVNRAPLMMKLPLQGGCTTSMTCCSGGR